MKHITGFDLWINELDKVATQHGYNDLSTQTGKECWQSYYDEEYTPEEAFLEDLAEGAR